MAVKDVEGEVGVGLGEFVDEFGFEGGVDGVPEGFATVFD